MGHPTKQIGVSKASQFIHRLQGHGLNSDGSGSQDAGEWTDTGNLKWLTDTQNLVTTHPLQPA